MIEVVATALEARWPQSRRRGRLGTPAEVVIRMLILNHLFDWSYDDLEQEVRANLVYRAFTRIDAGEVPDAKTILKIARARPGRHRAAASAGGRGGHACGVTHGRRFRIDTTVVETNVHYSTDSSLLQDGVRVLTRTMQCASAVLGDRGGRIRNRQRSVGRRALIIGRQAKSPDTREALVRSYRQLMATTRAVVRDATTMVRRISQRLPSAFRSVAMTLMQTRDRLQQMRPLVTRVLAQIRARLLGGDTHVRDKVLSVFEPHTEAIRKGKIAKPTFGKLVTIQESEHQIITAYEVHATRPADMTLWTPALDRHIAIFGRAPDVAAADRGFASTTNEDAARARCPSRDSAATGTENAGATRARTATLVPSRAALACRVRRPNQCARARTWSATLSVSWRGRYRSLGRARRHRRQSGQHRELLERAGRRIEHRRNETNRHPPGCPIGRSTARERSFLHREVV